jgi:hypothetical protein
MHHFYSIGAGWASTIICVQVRELAKPRACKNWDTRAIASVYPLSISASRHPTVPAPPKIDGFAVQTYALYFAQTMLLGR